MFAIPSPQSQYSRRRVTFWQHLHRVCLLTLAILWVTPSVSANNNPLATYCLARIAQRPKLPSAAQVINEEPPQITFRVKGELFHLAASRDRLLLTRGDDPTPLDKVPVPQRDFRRINALVLGRDGWLWIDGGEIDYMAPLDPQRWPPTLGLPVALPELMREPCVSLFWYVLGACMPADSTYSATLNRAFVTGHRVTLLGWPSLVSFEIVAGEAKRFPAKFRSARFVVDVPNLKGSLLRGRAGEVLFYDGVSIIPLLVDFPNRPMNDVLAGWRVEIFPTGRTYLRRGKNRPGRQPFLMELKAGPTLVPIPLSEKWLNCHEICACGW